MSMQKFSQTLQASATLRINVSGDYFRLGSTANPVTVRFYNGSAVISEMLLIDGGTWSRIRDGFSGIEIINSASGAQAVDIFIGRGEIGVDRIIGEVSVINGELSRVRSGKCFMGQANTSGAAGQYSSVELFNPVASGVNLILNKVSGFCSVSANLGIVTTAIALPTLVGSGSNKSLGGAGSAAKIRVDNAVGLVAGTTVLFGAVPSGYSVIEFLLSEPMLIAPGYGVYLYSATVAVFLGCTYQWIEENI